MRVNANAEIAERIEIYRERAERQYTTHGERAAFQCALADAARLCGLIGREIEVVSPHASFAAATAKRCGDVIWDLLELTDPSPKETAP